MFNDARLRWSDYQVEVGRVCNCNKMQLKYERYPLQIIEVSRIVSQYWLQLKKIDLSPDFPYFIVATFMYDKIKRWLIGIEKSFYVP